MDHSTKRATPSAAEETQAKRARGAGETRALDAERSKVKTLAERNDEMERRRRDYDELYALLSDPGDRLRRATFLGLRNTVAERCRRILSEDKKLREKFERVLGTDPKGGDGIGRSNSSLSPFK